jgi:hypothetical protein
MADTKLLDSSDEQHPPAKKAAPLTLLTGPDLKVSTGCSCAAAAVISVSSLPAYVRKHTAAHTSR